MRIVFTKRVPGQIEFGIIYGAIAVGVLLTSWFLPVLAMTPSCVFKGLFGIPCPTCGATRAVVHLSHGAISAAIAMNPIVAISLVLAVVFFIYSLATLVLNVRRIGFIGSEREKNAARVLVVVLLLTQWAYLIRTL
jgi:Protein of unknown function (DUF2752)